MSLFVYVIDPSLRALFRTHLEKRRSTDSGFDLLSQSTEVNGTFGVEMKLGVVCAAVTSQNEPAPYLLLARSSTSLTPLRMANQIGLADAGYRGELIARVDMFGTSSYKVDEGRRLFQIVQHNWLPWNKIIVVDTLDELPAPPDTRGGGGFGSTGQ
jgi:dUTP pyrophosphatase